MTLPDRFIEIEHDAPSPEMVPSLMTIGASARRPTVLRVHGLPPWVMSFHMEQPTWELSESLCHK
jgi:hypothetical protein